MKPILLLTGIETCVRPGHRERIAVYPQRMTLSAPHYWTGGRVVHNAAPRPADGTAQLRRIAHDDGTRSTLVEIAGALLPDARQSARLRLQVYDSRPDTLYGALRHWHGGPVRGDRAYSNTIFRMDVRSQVRWAALVRWLQARPDRRAALVDFALVPAPHNRVTLCPRRSS